MVRKKAHLVPPTEKGGLATPLWEDNEFKILLEKHMNSIVTERVKQLEQKYAIHPGKVWSMEHCKRMLGVRKD